MKSFLRSALSARVMAAQAAEPGGQADQGKHREMIAPLASLRPAY
ncbi:hypothetical protein [Sphingomonas sp. IBVSS2]|nr:hypothetical protein [Sphingomonas sp. IBVSS2]